MISIAICDNDKKDSIKIEAIVKNYLDTKLIPYQMFKFKSGEELLEFHDRVDLIFLDISMEGINGILAGQRMHEINRNIKIIYTTSYKKYFIQAVNNVHAFAYLEKPISKDKAEQQLDEAILYIQEENQKLDIVNFEILEITVEGEVEYKIKNFEVKDILYFEYFNRKIKIKLENEEFFLIDSMKDLAKKMQEHNFEICHQCFLVNLRHIKKIKGYDVFLDNDDKLPVSQKKSSDFRKKLNKFLQSSI